MAAEKAKRHSWTPQEVALLGTMPDSELAALIGIGESKVMYKRRDERIKNFGYSAGQDEQDWDEEGGLPEEEPEIEQPDPDEPQIWDNYVVTTKEI